MNRGRCARAPIADPRAERVPHPPGDETLLATLDSRFVLALGDLALVETEAIVNAANAELAGGGGVDGALHRAAGPELLAECRALHPLGCPTGAVRVTGAHRLRARWVFHAVGPVWAGGGAGEPELLAACYRRSIELAAALGARRLAFPAISCGVYGYPWAAAAEVACAAVADGLELHPAVLEARIVFREAALLDQFALARGRILAAKGARLPAAIGNNPLPPA